MNFTNDFTELLGISTEDLNARNFSKNEDKYQKLFQRALNHEKTQELFKKLNSMGINPNKEEATVRTFILEVSNDSPENNPVINQVLIPVYKGEDFIGGAVYTSGKSDATVFSVTQVENSGAHDIYYVEDGQVEHMLVKDGDIVQSSVKLEPQSNQVSAQAPSCMGVCGSICGAGFGSQIGTCVSQCRLAGPGYFWCVGLCAVIVGGGCVVGCDSLCSTFNG